MFKLYPVLSPGPWQVNIQIAVLSVWRENSWAGGWTRSGRWGSMWTRGGRSTKGGCELEGVGELGEHVDKRGG